MVEQLAAVGTALGALKTISDIAKNVNSIELTQKVIELQSSILDMQQKMGQLVDENRELRRQLEDRAALKMLADDMEFVGTGGYCIKKSDREKGVFKPLCPVCWDDDGKTIPMVPMANGYYTCPKHQTSYQTGSDDSPPVVLRRNRRPHPQL